MQRPGAWCDTAGANPEVEAELQPVQLPDGPGPMARLLLVVVVAAVVVGGGWKLISNSRGLSGWHDDINAGIDESRASGRPLLVLYTADWCGPCQQLKKHVLTDPEVADRLRQNYVLATVDLTAPDAETAAVAEEAAVRGIPTIVRYDANLKEVDRVVGGVPREAFLSWLDGQSRTRR